MTSIATTLLPPGRTPYGTDPPWVEPFGRGVVARGSQDTGIDRADTITAVADSGGVIGISVGRRPRGNPAAVLLHAVLEDELIPLASGLASALRASEAYGRVAIGLWVSLPRGGHFTDQAIASVPRHTRVSRELTVPAGDDEVRALAMSWHRELQRTVGVTKYEQEPRRQHLTLLARRWVSGARKPPTSPDPCDSTSDAPPAVVERDASRKRPSMKRRYGDVHEAS